MDIKTILLFGVGGYILYSIMKPKSSEAAIVGNELETGVVANDGTVVSTSNPPPAVSVPPMVNAGPTLPPSGSFMPHSTLAASVASSMVLGKGSVPIVNRSIGVHNAAYMPPPKVNIGGKTGPHGNMPFGFGDYIKVGK
jgi:hypothetical protein